VNAVPQLSTFYKVIVMFHRTLVDATDLHRWADRLDARSRLPELLRRLIHASPSSIERIGFPAGEGVQQGGWDGVLIAQSTHPFVPDGYSVWELGVNSKVKAKADEDYRKRTAEPRGLNPNETTYVFVTPRRWGGKDDWISERKEDGVWKEVRAYDADDVEQWLHQAPAVHLWLSIMSGKHPQTARDLETFWVDWSEVTYPPLSPVLLTSGREETLDLINTWLRGQAATLTVKADTRDEAVALLAALIQQMPADERLSLFARTTVVTDQVSWHHLVASNAELILVPTFDITSGTTRANQAGHHVFIPRGRDDSESSATVKLPRIRRSHARDVFISMGQSEERANDLALLARRSLMALRRRMAVNEEVQQPEWSKPAEARNILPALLAGGWSDTQLGDREIIARLARQEYDHVSTTLVRWANEPDPPVRKVGSAWMLSAKEDAWLLLARFLTRDDLERFEAVVLDVLGVSDPQFDLPLEQRTIAGLLGKMPAHSGLLRTGLVDTLALMGSYSHVTEFNDGALGQEWANRIVRALLRRGYENWHIWASLSDLLPRIAEAAPSTFLTEAEHTLETEPPLLLQLFEDGQSLPLFGSTAHTGLLWALELLAWNSDYLGRSAILLAWLAAREPGGKLMNRPISSLREIFLCWNAQTTATLFQRMDALDLLRQREPEVAWSVLCQILPGRHSISRPTSSPQWRDWIPEPRPAVTYAEVDEAAANIVERLLQDVGDDSNRWKALIELIDQVPQQAGEKIAQCLIAIDSATLSAETQLTIWETLRSLINKHKAFPEARWVLPVSMLEQLEVARERYLPAEPEERHSWLFSSKTEFMPPFGDDWEARHRVISEARLQAVGEVFALGGLDALLGFALKVEQSDILGHILGVSELLAVEEDRFISQYVRSDTPQLRQFARAFVTARGHAKGWEWIEAKVTTMVRENLSPAQQAGFFQFLPFAHRSWDLLASFEPETQQLYWSEVQPFGLLAEDYDAAVEQLLQHDRPQAAFYVTAARFEDPKPGISGERVADILERFIFGTLDPHMSIDLGGYHIAAALAYIEASGDVPDDRIARLEWLCLPLLENERRGPQVLHREMARNPQFFVELLTFVYRAENEEARDLTPDERLHHQRAYDLIRTWRRMPGEQADGSIDAEELQDWVAAVRSGAQAVERRAIADRCIGEVLARSPKDPDGSWPSIAVRNIIEAVRSENLEEGFSIQVYNSRGSFWKSLGEGGVQERGIAAKYRDYAGLVRGQWPRTAAILDRLVEDYLAQAREADLQAELEEDLLR
jgi:hypothetical protein